MIYFDIRTLLLNYSVINLISFILILLLHHQVKYDLKKTFWFPLSFSLTFFGNSLLLFRNYLPDIMTIVLGNILMMLSTIIFKIGLKSLLGIKINLKFNLFIFFLASIIISYFTLALNDIYVRTICFSLFYLIISPQIAYSCLKSDFSKPFISTQIIAYIFIYVFIIQFFRSVLFIFFNNGNTNYFKYNRFEWVFIINYEIIIFLLAFSVFLLINQKLIEKSNKEKIIISQLTEEKLNMELKIKEIELIQKTIQIASIEENNIRALNKLEQIPLVNYDNLAPIIKGSINPIKDSIKKGKIWKEFDKRLEESNSDFYKQIVVKFPQLNPNELRILFLLSQNYSSKEISIILNRSVKTIENSRVEIRKKINLSKNMKFSDFFKLLKA